MSYYPQRVVIFMLVTLFVSSVPVTSGTEELAFIMVSPSYTIEQCGDYHCINVEGFFTRGIPGNPQLPQKVYNVALPSAADLETVDMVILSQDKKEVQGVYEIKPAPLIAPGSNGTQGTGVYKMNALYPLTPVEILRTYQVRDKKFVRVQFTPFQYNPVTKTLVFTQKAKIKIFWTATVSYTALKGSGTGYVIVTTNAVVANSARLNAFIQHLQLQGFSVYTVTETQYGAAVGQQRAVNIRGWLQTNYVTRNIKYVLLIGDPNPDDPTIGDTFGDVPMMMCWPNPGAAADQTPTDYFYADLTGNWDSDSDNQYGECGEDAVDFGPDVYVGRIPVYGGNYTALDNILNKFINYTGANTSIMLPITVSNYQDEENVTNGCVAGWARTDGLHLPQEVITNITGPVGFTSYVMYETSGVVGRGHDPVPGTAYGFKAPVTNANIINEWTNDYGIVFWWAHGSQTAASRKYWLNDLNSNFIVEDGACAAGDELAWPNLLSSGDTALLADTETFTFQASCLNGYPENSNNLQYALLKKGAVCTVGATRWSWYAQGMWTFTGVVDNAGIGYMYVGNLVYGWTAGEALYNGKNALVNPWGWQGWQNLFDFNLYGDPSLYLEGPLKKPKPPKPTPTPVNVPNLCPLAHHRIEEAKDLLEVAKELLEEAKKERKDVSDIEVMIAEAEEILEKAKRYCLGHNCIAGNYWAIKATETLLQAIAELREML